MVESPEPRIQFVSQYELNVAFESMVARYVQLQIEIESVIKREHAPNTAYNQPPGTRSILAEPIDPTSHQLCALVHYYLLPDGVTIGASGKMDSTGVVFQGVDFRVRDPSSVSDG